MSPSHENSSLALCIELGASVPTIALLAFEGGGKVPHLVVERELPGASRASETVLDEIALALDAAGSSLAQVDRFLTSSGPGSFTGLRVAFSVLKAFAFALQRPFEVVSAHECLALRRAALDPPGTAVRVATRLTRDKWLVSDYQTQGPDAHVVAGNEGLSDAATDADPTAIRASYLGRFAHMASSLERFDSLGDIARASPQYPGSRNWSARSAR